MIDVKHKTLFFFCFLVFPFLILAKPTDNNLQNFNSRKGISGEIPLSVIDFTIDSIYCNNNGTPCAADDDLVCVNMTIYETGIFNVSWKNCTNGVDINVTDYSIKAGQSFTVCLSRTAAISVNCTDGNQALLWIQRRFGDFKTKEVLLNIPPSCSSMLAPNAPTVLEASRNGIGSLTLNANCLSEIPFWYTSLKGGTAFLIGNNYTSVFSKSATYFVSCKNKNGCESSRVTVTATVK